MMSYIEIKLVDPMESFDAAIPLLEANWKESGNPFDFDAADTKAFFKKMATINTLLAIGVFKDNVLVGYSVVTIAPHPLNFSIRICDVSGLYLIPELRGGNTFGRISDLIKNLAEEYKANFIHWHAPARSEFSGVLSSRFEPISNYFRENVIPSMSDSSIEKAREMEKAIYNLPQISIATDHILHAGVYTRTVMIPKDGVISGVLVKRSVNLIISGHCIVYLGDDEAREYKGYVALTAMANRKQVFIAKENTYLTMFFATDAREIAEAESQFTDEVGTLMSRQDNAINNINITGV